MNDTTTPPPPPPGPQSTGTASAGSPRTDGPDRERFRSLTEARRATDGRLVAGVSAGLGRHLGIDPVIVRIVFVALSFAGLAGVILYATAWFVLPSDNGRPSVMADWFRLDATEPQARTVALVIGGALALASVVGDTGWFWGVTWPLFALWLVIPALFFYWLFAVLPRQRTGRTAGTASPWVAPPAAYPAPTTVAGPADPAPADPVRVPLAPDDSLHDGDSDDPDHDNTAILDGEHLTQAGSDVPPPPPSVPPTPGAPVPPTPFKPRTPPTLFLATMSAMAVVLGVMALVDVSTDTAIPPAGYFAAALGVTGLGLLVGARWGRSVALIPVGLVLGFALAVASVFPSGPVGDVRHAPITAVAVDPTYDIAVGSLRVDLTEVTDPAELLGRTVTVDGGVGEIRIVVPRDLNVSVHAYITGGDIRVLDENTSGHQAELTVHGDPGPRLHLEINQTFGQIIVERA